ncbi:MAG: hypothetical protein EXS31_06320 [Pedosphaera sp.]|nr:hypothetical protein [Pedosphaera sp.]
MKQKAVDASVTYILEKFPLYTGQFPIRFFGEYANNPAAPTKNQSYQGGIQFGKSGKKGTWDLTYRYIVLGADSMYEELVDSDFGAYYGTGPAGSGVGAGYGPGTNLRGHVVKMAYSPYDSFTFGITYYLASVIDELPSGSKSEVGRIQVDAIWKF